MKKDRKFHTYSPEKNIPLACKCYFPDAVLNSALDVSL